MTTIAKDFAAKLGVAVVAAAMAISAFAPAAQAQTTEELQQMINDLLAQVAQLQGNLGQTGGAAAGVCPYTWTRDLSTGATGGDVKMLQMFLNADPDTRVAASGVGSAGMESDYFGGLTAAAVSKFQVKYRADILSPAGLVNPTGYFGPGSRGKANALCVASAVEEEVEEDMDEDEDEEDEEEDTSLRGEASLDSFDLDNGESTIEEGEDDVVVGEVTLEFADGDAEISRIDVALVADGANNGDSDPWDVFETISLWVDGDKVAEKDIDDEDNYLDEDDGSVRFSGLDLIAREDDEVEILIAVTVQNNIDGVGPADDETWTLTVDAMRYFDADGVATTDTSTGDIGGAGVDFDIEEEGAGEDLDVSLSSNNPDGTDIVVDTDNDTDGVTILVADLEAEDNDMELNNVVVRVDTTGASTSKVVDTIYVVIDGEEFRAEKLVSTNKGTISKSQSRYVDNDVSDDSVWYAFDIDGDIIIDEDDEVEMEVVVDFNDTDDGNRYANGTLIDARVTSVELAVWDVDGANDVTPGGSAVGDQHTLVAEGILVPADGFTASVDTLGQNDTIGEFTLEFEVTAVEDDFYITESAAAASTTPADGVAYSYTGTVGSGTVTGTLTSTADEDTAGVFTVREGTTETFTLVVSIDPQATGIFRVSLNEIWYSANTDGVTGALEYNPLPISDFRTNTQTIQGS